MTIEGIYVGVIPFAAMQLSIGVLCFMFPQVILWLPQQIGGGSF